jgi:excisionase family DNA binding protein
MVAAAHNPPALLVDSREAARLLCVSESTLKRLTASGELKSVRFLRTVRYSPAELTAWIERKTAETAQPAML